MKIFDMFLMCVRNLWRRKARTMLTVIGVIIGSCSVIVMISLGLGMSQSMDDMMKSMTNITTINVSPLYSGGMAVNTDSGAIDDNIIEKIKKIDHVSYVIPRLEVGYGKLELVAGNGDRYVTRGVDVCGIDFSIIDKMGFKAVAGDLSSINENTVIMGANVPYYFEDTKKKKNNQIYFWQTNADGSLPDPYVDVSKDRVRFCVVNTKKQDSKGQNVLGGKGYEFKIENPVLLERGDDYELSSYIYISIDYAKELITAYNRLNGTKSKSTIKYTNLKVVADDINNVDEIQKKIKEMDLNAYSSVDERNRLQGTIQTNQMILGGLAAISLLVAAISITNTMIMSIYERTREIGVMKVLGCFIDNIRFIFLMEAGLIGLFGGVVGSVLSYIISFVMNSVGGSMTGMFGIDDYTASQMSAAGSSISIIPIWLILVALAFSTLIGLVSGYYPANRAVKISALEAIKNE